MTDEETIKRIRDAGKAVLDQAAVMDAKEVARELAKLACECDVISALNACEREMLKRNTCR